MKKFLLIMAMLLALTLTLCACQGDAQKGQDENKTEFTAKELFGLDLTEMKAITLKLNGANVSEMSDIEKAAGIVNGVSFKKIDAVEIESGISVAFTIGGTESIAFPVSKDKTQGEVINYDGQWYQVSENILDQLVAIADKYTK